MIKHPSNMCADVDVDAHIQMIIFMDNSIINKFIRCTLKLIHEKLFWYLLLPRFGVLCI